jgi:hypothetical protein
MGATVNPLWSEGTAVRDRWGEPASVFFANAARDIPAMNVVSEVCQVYHQSKSLARAKKFFVRRQMVDSHSEL